MHFFIKIFKGIFEIGKQNAVKVTNYQNGEYEQGQGTSSFSDNSIE